METQRPIAQSLEKPFRSHAVPRGPRDSHATPRSVFDLQTGRNEGHGQGVFHRGRHAGGPSHRVRASARRADRRRGDRAEGLYRAVRVPARRYRPDRGRRGRQRAGQLPDALLPDRRVHHRGLGSRGPRHGHAWRPGGPARAGGHELGADGRLRHRRGRLRGRHVLRAGRFRGSGAHPRRRRARSRCGASSPTRNWPGSARAPNSIT